MTELVYVPRKLAPAWKKKGWIVIDTAPPPPAQQWACLMAPPDWEETHLKERWEKIEDDKPATEPDKGDWNG